MQRNNKYFFMCRIMVLLWSGLMMTVAQAAEPLWTIIPAPGSNPTQTVSKNRVATLLYVVQNQSGKPKNLVIQPIPGIAQTAPCQLSPKGRAGSSCTLNLAITGSRLPSNGVHGGPSLCQANMDGSPNPNQCYQPSRANSLHITRGPATNARITVNPSALSFVAGNNGLITVTNSLASSERARTVVATIPGGSNISVQSTTCGRSLAIGASCTITFTAPTAQGPINIGISGSNTNTANVAVTVTPVPNVVITMTGSPLQLQTRGDSGEITITNTSSSVVARNIKSILTGTLLSGKVSETGNTCGNLAPGASCQLTFTPGVNAVQPSNFQIKGTNTNTLIATIGIRESFAYVTNTDINSILLCPINLNGLFGSCVDSGNTGIAFDGPVSVAINQNATLAYVTNTGNSTVSLCPINDNGTLAGCVDSGNTGIAFDEPRGIALNESGTIAYVSNTGNNTVSLCPININGSFGACVDSGNTGISFAGPRNITLKSNFAYVANRAGNTVSLCPINLNGFFGECINSGNSGIPFARPQKVVVLNSGDLSYVSNESSNQILRCPINDNNTFGDCVDSGLGEFFNDLVGITINQANTFVYAANSDNNQIAVCSSNDSGTLTGCLNSGNTGLPFVNPQNITLF